MFGVEGSIPVKKNVWEDINWNVKTNFNAYWYWYYTNWNENNAENSIFFSTWKRVNKWEEEKQTFRIKRVFREEKKQHLG